EDCGFLRRTEDGLFELDGAELTDRLRDRLAARGRGRPFGPPAVGGSKMRARPRRVSAPPVRPVAHSAGNAADSVVSSGGSKMPPRPAPSNGGRAELAKGRAPGAPAAPCCSPSPARESSLR